eukprot:4643520-Amphidinium_carterae.1
MRYDEKKLEPTLAQLRFQAYNNELEKKVSVQSTYLCQVGEGEDLEVSVEEPERWNLERAGQYVLVPRE